MVFGLQRFLIDTEQLVANALEQDRCNHLEAQADTIVEARDFGLPRSEWSKTKVLMQFGGRPPKIPTTFPYSTTEDGTALCTESDVANNLQQHFAKVESG
eukprot:8199180-Pyramimonas_sp.AAC.1